MSDGMMDSLKRIHDAGGHAWDSVEDPVKFIREMRGDESDRITALETALAAMTAERDARDVAIGVLGDRVRSCEHMLACYRVGRRPSDVALDTASHTAQEVDTNPLARAAVEGER